MELPVAFEQRMKEMLGEEYQQFAESYDRERTQGLRLNLLKTDRDRFLKVNPFRLKPVPWAAEGFYYEKGDRPGRHPYHEAGVYYIQEPSAMTVVSFLDPQPGEKILDLCAAPGGKTTQAASRLQGCGFLLSNEIHPARAKILSQNVERMGVRNAVVTNEDSGRLAEYFPEFFDAIIVDAPCSGEGMFRKDETAVKEWSPENVMRCAERQEEILENAFAMLKPGGRLVYSTCTFAPEENEKSVGRFLLRHPEMQIRPVLQFEGLSRGVPEWGEGVTEQLCETVRVWPHRTDGEGHYIALLSKSGEPEERKRKKPAFLKDKKLLADYLAFAQNTFRSPEPWSRTDHMILFGEQLYLLPPEMPAFEGLRVLRPGLHLGSFKKNRFEPSHALAMALRPEEVRMFRSYPADSPQISSYLNGETLADDRREAEEWEDLVSEDLKKGWVLMLTDGWSCGFAKLAGGTLKNHYPKGLRRMV